MQNIQNEIKYAIAFSILKMLLEEGHITHNEFEMAHEVIASRFGPEITREMQWQ